MIAARLLNKIEFKSDLEIEGVAVFEWEVFFLFERSLKKCGIHCWSLLKALSYNSNSNGQIVSIYII